jgi:putative hydrolase of HD superfamily
MMKRRKKTKAPVLDLLLEAGMLKRLVRSGWQVVGVTAPESVADHSFRCAVIGYVLAHSEKACCYTTMLMTLFGDLQEARIGDLHKMAQTYITSEGAEDRAFFEQIKDLPQTMQKELKQARKEYRAQKTKESLIARDADILECLIQAKEYHQQGFRQAARFMKKAPRFLKTKSARLLWKKAKARDLNDWWFKLATFTR